MELCNWTYDDYHDMYQTSCDQAQQFMNDGIKENHYKYCPYCGKEIFEVPVIEDEEDEEIV